MRRRWDAFGAVARALIPGLMVVGLFAMHGVQAATSPADLRVLPLGAHALPAHDVSMTAMTGVAAMTGTPGHDVGIPGGGVSADSDGSHHAPAGHRHPGGQMCLALLAVGVLLLLACLLVRRWRWRATPSRPAERTSRRGGRSPPAPSLYRLSVLRL